MHVESPNTRGTDGGPAVAPVTGTPEERHMSDNHGQSTASWTGTILILVGSLLICLGMVWSMSWMWIAGIVVTVGGIVAWIALEKAGKGAKGFKSASHG